MSESTVIQLMVVLISIGISKHSLELIAVLKRLPQVSHSSTCCIVIRLMMAIAAILLAANGFLPVWVCASQLAIELWHHYLFRMLRTGFYTMNLVVLSAVTVASIDPTDLSLQFVCIVFVVLMALLAYFKNGWSKLRSAAWRDGRFMPEMLVYSHYQMPSVGRFLGSRPGFTRTLSRLVILFELSFPFGLLLGTQVTLLFLACGLLFHFGIAFLLRIPGFFWSFSATYPAIYYIAKLSPFQIL